MAVKKTYMRMGDLDTKVSFYRENFSENAYDGRIQYAQQDIKEDVWASIGYVGSPSAGSSEENLMGQRTGKMKLEIVCRYFPNLKFNDYFIHNEGRFEIYSIQIIGRNRGYVLRAELRDDDSSKLPTGATLS